MGLDTVELVMEMEETFDITIADIDAERIGTVGQAYRYILARVALSDEAPCQTAAQFYRVRRALLARTGADRRSIRPDSEVEDFLPGVGRREVWLALGEAIGSPLPRLQLSLDPGRLALFFAAMSIPSLIASWAALDTSSVDRLFLMLLGSFLLWPLFAGLLYALLRPYATELSPDCRTIRSLVLATLCQPPAIPAGAARVWHPDEVWVVLRDLIAKQVGVSRDQVTEEKSFINDFWLD